MRAAPRTIAGLVLMSLVASCTPTASPSSPAASATHPAVAVPTVSPETSVNVPPDPTASASLATLAPSDPSPSLDVSPSVAPSASLDVSPSVAPSAGASPSSSPGAGSGAVAHDPRKFGFAAKGMSNEMMAFVTVGQLDYALETMDWDVVSTVAFFSLEATAEGTIADDKSWEHWNGERVDRLIEKAHSNGSKVVISLERFAWSPGQTAISRTLLGDRARRERLARAVAEEVARRGVDGVNVDFEPIPSGQADEFTHFVRTLRRELDRVAPGSQLTFCVVGHHGSYDVDAATGPDAADAVYLMGYHYAGTWSTRAGSTAPMGGPAHDVVDSVKTLLREVERHELIVGVPYYGHAWPTAGERLNAATQDGGFDVPLERAMEIAARYGAKYDEVEQVAWVPYRARPCEGCAARWYQLYFDDARAAEYKWSWIKRNKLLGTGVWTIGYEGELGDVNAAMRRVLLPGG